MPTQVRPPSVVRVIEVHGGCPHGAVPSAQPSELLIQVRSTARKPAGTGPPAATGAGAAPARAGLLEGLDVELPIGAGLVAPQSASAAR